MSFRKYQLLTLLLMASSLAQPGPKRRSVPSGVTSTQPHHPEMENGVVWVGSKRVGCLVTNCGLVVTFLVGMGPFLPPYLPTEG